MKESVRNNIIIVGYSGHSYVCIEIALILGFEIIGYCDVESKSRNPYNLTYLGNELDRKNLDLIEDNDYFLSIGNNQYRYNAFDDVMRVIKKAPISLIDPKAVVSNFAKIGDIGNLIMPNSCINAFAKLGNGAIINTGAIIEHECVIGDFAHIAPGAVLAGNVTVGDLSFIGANAVVKQGVTIGKNCTIGAGTVVLIDVPDGATFVGNPGRVI